MHFIGTIWFVEQLFSLQIEYFIKLARHLNFSKTAAELCVSQAAISKQIIGLEAEFEVTLFLRKYRTLSLTPAGEVLLNYFKKADRDFDTALSEAKALHAGTGCRLKVGLLEGLDLSELYERIVYFQTLNPGFQIDVDICSINALMNGIFQGDYDLIFTFHHELEPNSYLKTVPVISARFQMYYSKSHPLAGRDRLVADDFRNETICAPIRNEESIIREYMNRIYSVCGFMPRELICKPNLDSVFAEVEFRGRVAMLYDKTIVKMPEAFKTFDLGTDNHICLVTAKEKVGAHTRRLIEFLKPLFI